MDAVFVYTETGHMASLLSRCHPDCPIFAFTSSTSLRRHLNLQWGLIPFRLSFSDDMESNLNRTFSLLKARGMIQPGDLVIALSDMLQSIQVMHVPWGRFYRMLISCLILSASLGEVVGCFAPQYLLVLSSVAIPIDLSFINLGTIICCYFLYFLKYLKHVELSLHR